MKYTKIKNITKVKSEPVYHMTVEKNHNFFANNLCVHNCDYIGEIKLIIYNTGAKGDFTFKNGDRIAQAVLAPVMSSKYTTLRRVDKINKQTQRGSGGFNSTGVK